MGGGGGSAAWEFFPLNPVFFLITSLMANFVCTNFKFRSRLIVFGIEHCKESMSTSRFAILSGMIVFSRPPALGLGAGLPVVPVVHPVVPVVHPVVHLVVHTVVHPVVHPQLPLTIYLVPCPSLWSAICPEQMRQICVW